METIGLAQEGLARKLNKSSASVNRWLGGRRAWPFDVVLEVKELAKESGHELSDQSFVVRPPIVEPESRRGKRRSKRAA